VGSRRGSRGKNLDYRSPSTRKKIRLPKVVYEKQSRPFFITICTYDKIPLLTRFGELVFRSIMEGHLRQKSELMAVCIMPDHLHLLLAPLSENIIDLMGRWKGYTSHLIRDEGYEGRVWQRSFYDHALRKEEDVMKVAEYIVSNPVRRGLVKRWRDYPFSWHKWL
jgi:putative transposase